MPLVGYKLLQLQLQLQLLFCRGSGKQGWGRTRKERAAPETARPSKVARIATARSAAPAVRRRAGEAAPLAAWAAAIPPACPACSMVCMDACAYAWLCVRRRSLRQREAEAARGLATEIERTERCAIPRRAYAQAHLRQSPPCFLSLSPLGHCCASFFCLQGPGSMPHIIG